MPTFKLNMFGTTHRNETGVGIKPNLGDFLLFNIHILQVEYSDIVLGTFDMFIEYFAYPFNPVTNYTMVLPNSVPTYGGNLIGTTISSYVPGTTQGLGARRGAGIRPKPQVIHLTATTPTSTINLYECGFGNNPNPLPITPLSTCIQPTVFSPCPNSDDFRLFSMSHYVKLKPIRNFKCFDPDWTDMKSTQQTINDLYVVNNGVYRLPIKVVIIANGCSYIKDAEINIYSDWFNNTAVLGSAECQFNPLYRPLGYDDKITIT